MDLVLDPTICRSYTASTQDIPLTAKVLDLAECRPHTAAMIVRRINKPVLDLAKRRSHDQETLYYQPKNKTIMSKTNYGYDLDQQIEGKSISQYLADLAEKNEKQEVEIERAKIALGIANALRKHSQACMAATSLDAKLARKDAEFANLKAELAEAKVKIERNRRK